MPAAIGIRMGQPRRPVIAIVGDGSRSTRSSPGGLPPTTA
ncbi:thiamine pyrophosphate-dependent enzyme [Streptomyces sp. NPDC102274]